MLWPSKLGFLLTLPRPLLWVGPVAGAIAEELRPLPHAGIFAPGQAREIAEWLIDLRNREAAVPDGLEAATAQRAAALENFRGLITHP